MVSVECTSVQVSWRVRYLGLYTCPFGAGSPFDGSIQGRTESPRGTVSVGLRRFEIMHAS